MLTDTQFMLTHIVRYGPVNMTAGRGELQLGVVVVLATMAVPAATGVANTSSKWNGCVVCAD